MNRDEYNKAVERARRVRLVRTRIYNTVDPSIRPSLEVDDNYSAPYSFWGTALRHGLISQGEYDEAREHYGDLWHYTGD